MPASEWKSKVKASGIHLLASLGFGLLAGIFIFFIWYPPPYQKISGGSDLFLLLISIDIVIGPMITFVIYSRKKSRQAITLDFIAIAILQSAALAYGMWTLFVARPVYLVFEYKNFSVVHAIDLDPMILKKSSSPFKNIPLDGPKIISLRKPERGDEQLETMTIALHGVTESEQPNLWQPYEMAKNNILSTCNSIFTLKEKFPQSESDINSLIAQTGVGEYGLCHLPLLSRGTVWTIIIDRSTVMPAGYLPLDSF